MVNAVFANKKKIVSTFVLVSYILLNFSTFLKSFVCSADQLVHNLSLQQQQVPQRLI